jgi:Fe-S cluster assembly ATPase SufC
MSNDNVYYIHVKEYKHMLPSNEMLNRYLNSPLSNDIKNKDEFRQFSAFNLKYNVVEKDKHEHDIDIIVSKKMLEHIKEFFNKDEPMMKLKFYNKHQKSFKKNNKTNNNNNTNTNNKTLKKNK